MASLVSKIAKAALDVGGKLSADKTNQEQRYDYLSADKILSVCGQALVGQGVVVLPEVTEYEVKLYEYTDSYGKAKKRYDSRVSFSFVISDGEQSETRIWYGMGSDYTVPDKAMYKAITSGHKYFLMKLLCVGAGNEDGEHESEEQPAQVQRQAEQHTPTNGSGKHVAPVMPEQPPAGANPFDEPEQPKPPKPIADKPKVTRQPVPTFKMTRDEAEAETTKEGVRYGDLDSSDLEAREHGIAAGLRTPGLTLENKENLKRKSMAISVILQAREAEDEASRQAMNE